MSREEQRRISVYIPEDMFTQLENSSHTITDAVTTGLDLFLGREKEADTKPLEYESSANHELLISYQARIASLEEHLRNKESSSQERIEDLKEQLKVKDQQLEKKDNQVEKLTESVQAQALNIHNLINQRALEPPTAEKKKPFWKFW